jgi:hypothetical protein
MTCTQEPSINCSGNVRQNHKGMQGFNNKTLKLKWGDIHARVRGVLTAMILKDRRDMCILTNEHNHQQMATSMMNTGKLINLPPLKTTVRKLATLTKGTQLLIAIQLVTEHGNGHRNYFFTCWF